MISMVEQIKARFSEDNAGFWIGPGWYTLVYIADLVISSYAPDYKIVQLKQKFGGLRYYVDHKTIPADVIDQVREVIHKAEEISFSTCEVCGGPGECNKEGSLITLCGYHRDIHDSDKYNYEVWSKYIGASEQGVVRNG